MGSVRDELKRQLVSNKNTLPHYKAFEAHRERVTDLILTRAGEGGGRVCVLGAGNCYDLDLERLGAVFERIHLVDLDPVAVRRARARQTQALQSRIELHAPLDVSGFNAHVAAWRDGKVTPDALMAFPARVAHELERALPGPFEVVVSACLLSQLLLTLRRVMHERHPLFEAASLVVCLGHLRALVRLTRPGRDALFVTDVSSNEIAPLESKLAGQSLLPLLAERQARGQLFHALAPPTLTALFEEDPVLVNAAKLGAPLDAWLWQNGPTRAFLVYALALTRNPV